VVATHDIHSDSHNPSGSGRDPHRRYEGSGSGRDGKDLAPLVIAASGTDPVRDIGSSALRAGAELGKFHDTVIRPTHALAALGRLTLGNTHKIIRLLKFQFV